jgi:YggT family protein
MCMIVLTIVENLFFVYLIMLFVRILGSWIPELQGQRWMQFIIFYTDPYLNLFRRIIPPLGMIDISPIFAFIALNFIEKGVLFLLYKLIA